MVGWAGGGEIDSLDFTSENTQRGFDSFRETSRGGESRKVGGGSVDLEGYLFLEETLRREEVSEERKASRNGWGLTGLEG